MTKEPTRLIVAMTGASGSVYGVRLLERLRDLGVETHLVISRWGARTLVHETPYSVDHVHRLATAHYAPNDLGAVVSSGSFLTLGMVILPCSMKTLGEVAHGVGDSLVARAADVVLKERRRLVLGVREAPYNDIHLENMLKLSRMGAIIAPPAPAFYLHPATIEDLVQHTVSRTLDLFGLHTSETPRWDGRMAPGTRRTAPDAVDV